MKINSPLVVLSACNTGSGKLYSGEGFMSLARNFVLAGVPSVVETLWPVEDIAGSKAANNLQLTKLCKFLFGSHYRGTYTSDGFPSNIKNNDCFILNTDSSKSVNKFGHCVAFYKLNNKIYYYDSYARSASELSKYWANKGMVNANKNGRDQSFESSICGPMCVSWLVLVNKFGKKCINVI